MNNGSSKHTLPQRPPPSTVVTRGSRHPSFDVKLNTNDGEQKLILSNISGIRTKEAAIDFAARVGLLNATGVSDPTALGTKLNRSLLITARRVQEHTSDPSAQDAVWTMRFLCMMLQDLWQSKYSELQAARADEQKQWKDEREGLQKALKEERDERKRLELVDWTAEPTVNTKDIANEVTSRIQSSITTQLAAFNKANVAEAAKLDALHQRMSILDSAVKEVGAAVEGFATSLSGRPTYASVTATPSPADPYAGRSHAEQDAIARAGLQERRVLITANSERQNIWLDNTPTQHIAKARMGIEAAHSAHSPPAPLDDISAVIPTNAFRAGKFGVVFCFPSKEAASWFSSEPVWNSFIKKYEGDVKLRPRHFIVVLRNVPVTYDPTLPDFIDNLCSGNSLPRAWIDNIRWLKPAERRSGSQLSAHALVAFRSAEWANEVLDRGTLSFDGSVYRVERLIRDSPRCAKCQKHGHFAGKCKGEFACGFCAGKGHHSNACTARDKPRCATCSTIPDCDADHPAWARECPARLRSLERLQRSNPEDFEPRFLTPDNASLAFANKLAPLRSVITHRTPTSSSGAQKYSKPVEPADPAAKKRGAAGRKAASTTSRPATPAGSEASAAPARSRASSLASAASSTNKTNKKPATSRSRRSSSSMQAVEDSLASQASAI